MNIKHEGEGGLNKVNQNNYYLNYTGNRFNTSVLKSTNEMETDVITSYSRCCCRKWLYNV